MKTDSTFIPLKAPLDMKKILLHVCCAPCSGAIIEELLHSGIEPFLYFCNPNIYPEQEYLKRKNEVIRFAETKKLQYFDPPYDPLSWNQSILGLEKEPERGKRCTVCFEFRLKETARFAAEKEFPVFATTLGISRWKDMDQVNASGKKAQSLYSKLTFWPHNWRENEGQKRMLDVVKRENFYRQNYCGCLYSIRKKAG